jgi:hypothetical protein
MIERQTDSENIGGGSFQTRGGGPMVPGKTSLRHSAKHARLPSKLARKKKSGMVSANVRSMAIWSHGLMSCDRYPIRFFSKAWPTGALPFLWKLSATATATKRSSEGKFIFWTIFLIQEFNMHLCSQHDPEVAVCRVFSLLSDDRPRRGIVVE